MAMGLTMPSIEYWIHPSCSLELLSGPRCPVCGQEAEYAGWHRTIHEHMALFQYIYGFKPHGPHKLHVRELLYPLREPCTHCGGSGWTSVLLSFLPPERFITLRPADGRQCPHCEGTGGFWICSAEAVERIRRQIIDLYPHGELAYTTPRFLGLGLMYNQYKDFVEEPGPDRRRIRWPARPPAPDPGEGDRG